MTRLRDGRFIAIAERPRGDERNSPVVIFDRDPTDPAVVARTSLFVPPDGFRPTDVVEMPDGSLSILTRSYQPPFAFDGRLIKIARDAIGTRKISGKTVVQFTRPLDENFEALAVTQSNGRAYIWIMSDDNFMPFQRTMLVLLEVIG